MWRREQLLRSWQAKRRGGFLHQSKNPRCSELRKSFRISQRIAPVPVFLLARALEAAPPELGVRPAAVLRNPPYPPVPLSPKPALARFADVASAAPSHPPIQPIHLFPQSSPAPLHYPQVPDGLLPPGTPPPVWAHVLHTGMGPWPPSGHPGKG